MKKKYEFFDFGTLTINELVMCFHKFKRNRKPYDPLDGDDVDELTEHIRNALNLDQGNITIPEFEKLERDVPKTVGIK